MREGCDLLVCDGRMAGGTAGEHTPKGMNPDGMGLAMGNGTQEDPLYQ
jgi:hypothetical protein